MSDTESDNSTELGHLRYKRSKSGKRTYDCSYCGAENILSVNNHFDHLEYHKTHFVWGSCKEEHRDNKFYGGLR